MTFALPRRSLATAAIVVGVLAVGDAQAAEPAVSRWSPSDIQELLGAIEDSNFDRLRPQDYGISELITELMSGTQDMSALADRSALALAYDLNEGAAPPTKRKDWHIARPPMDYVA
jgi:hypothetical protein